LSQGVQVEHRNQGIGKDVAGDENPAFLDQQRRMAGGMWLMLDDANMRAVPRNLRRQVASVRFPCRVMKRRNRVVTVSDC
jgi:hypothetical protein